MKWMKRKQKEWINQDKSGEEIGADSFKTNKKMLLENQCYRRKTTKTNSKKIEIIKLQNKNIIMK